MNLANYYLNVVELKLNNHFSTYKLKMKLATMIRNIQSLLKTEYHDYLGCLDIIKIQNICEIHESKKESFDTEEESSTNIEITSPCFQDVENEFQKKYSFFIKIIHSCLKLKIKIFDCQDDVAVLKNNYDLITTLQKYKKRLIANNIRILREMYQEINQPIVPQYDVYHQEFYLKLCITQQILSNVRKLVSRDVLKKNDNLLSLVMPYFYKRCRFIEEYK